MRSGTGILYVWNDGAIGLSIHKGRVADIRSFTRGDGGNDEQPVLDEAFRPWLEEHAGTRFHVIVDTVDETHVIEDLPPVGRRDRENLIRKRIAQRFREVEFVASRMLATRRLPRRRMTDAGPKDANRPARQVYLGGLIDDQVLAPWIDAMQAAGTRIRSLTSPALLTPDLLRRATGGEDGLVLNLLPGGLRQTLVLDGVVRFSRLAILHDKRPTALLEEIERTIQYLTTSRRLMAQQVESERFTVWVGEPGLETARRLPAVARFKGAMSARIAVLSAGALDAHTLDEHAELAPFIGACQRPGSLEYTTRRVRHHDLCGIWRTRLWTGAGVLAALGLVLSLGSGPIADALLPDTDHFATMRDRFQRDADELTGRLSQYGITATEVGAISDAARLLRARNTRTRDVLSLVAAGMHGDTGLRLTQVNWLRVPLGSTGVSSVAAPAMIEGPGQGPAGAMAGMAGAAQETFPAEPVASPVSLTVAGSVDRAWSKTEANDRVSAFVERLLKQCECTVSRLVLPYDPAPAVALSQSYISQSNAPLAFEIELDVRAMDRARSRP